MSANPNIISETYFLVIAFGNAVYRGRFFMESCSFRFPKDYRETATDPYRLNVISGKYLTAGAVATTAAAHRLQDGVMSSGFTARGCEVPRAGLWLLGAKSG